MAKLCVDAYTASRSHKFIKKKNLSAKVDTTLWLVIQESSWAPKTIQAIWLSTNSVRYNMLQLQHTEKSSWDWAGSFLPAG